jgi:hypothetical protein
VWDRNASTNQILHLVIEQWRSDMDIAHEIDDGRSKFRRVIGAYVTVDDAGKVYVSWHNYSRGHLVIGS